MKKVTLKTHTISFQEKTSRGFVDKSFDCPKEHVDWHLTQLKKMCYDIRVEIKKG